MLSYKTMVTFSVKYCLLLLLCVSCVEVVKSADTLFVQSAQDLRYQRYLDSITAYTTGYTVAKNMADTISHYVGNNALDAYFLSGFAIADSNTGGYFFDFHENEPVQIGHISDEFHGMRNEAKFPWEYLDAQYKLLDKLRVEPMGVMMGAELPNVYVYRHPAITVVVRPVRKFTVIYPGIKFALDKDGKTKVSYILKYYFSQTGNELQQVDSIETLDPIYHKHIDLPKPE